MLTTDDDPGRGLIRWSGSCSTPVRFGSSIPPAKQVILSAREERLTGEETGDPFLGYVQA